MAIDAGNILAAVQAISVLNEMIRLGAEGRLSDEEAAQRWDEVRQHSTAARQKWEASKRRKDDQPA